VHLAHRGIPAQSQGKGVFTAAGTDHEGLHGP
jgi:hypothetical protein